MKTYNVHEAKTKFSSLLAKVSGGERVVIAKAGDPIAMLVPFPGAKKKRVPGIAKGRFVIHKEFFDQMDEAFLEYFS